MTNINSNGFTKNSRGSDTLSDSLTATDPHNAKTTATTHYTRTPSQSRFAEYLASSAPKAGTAARPAPQSMRPNHTRTSASAQPAAMPAGKAQPTPVRPHDTKAPWERLSPAPRPIPDTGRRPNMQTEAPVHMAAHRPIPESVKSHASTSSFQPKLPTHQIDESTAPMPALALPTKSISEESSSLTPATLEADEDWQQRLQQIMAAGSPELFMQQSPALALLAGRLEFLEPAQIPAIVAQSPLLQSILSHSQAADALQTALPLEQNLQALGLVPATIHANNAGSPATSMFDQPVMKLADTLKALGFDVARLVQEGNLLKDNIGLDGLQSYMQRAERLRATQGLPVEWPTLPTASISVPQNPKNTAQTADAMDPELTAKLSRLAPTSAATVQLWSQLPEQPELMPLTVVDDGNNSPIFLAPMETTPEGWDPFAETTPALDSDHALLPPTMDNVPLVMNILPRAPSAVQDPFLAMAQRWNSETLQTLQPEDFLNHEHAEPLAEQTASSMQPLRSLDDLLNRQLIQPPDFNTRMDSAAFPAQENSSFDINSLQLSLQDVGTSQDNQGGDLSGRNQNQSFLSQDANSMFAPAPGSAASNKAFTLETVAAPQTPSAPVSPQQLQDILDKSSMLIKDGGGSIRLDLGSNEMGPLDLALDIHDKTVELRIVTHSDQAREALVQELPKLRESLQNQNLNLEKVEIGLSYSSAWSQSSGNGQQNREQFFENMSESSSRGPQGLRSTSRSYRQSFVSGPETRVPLHNGLIQVRV